MTEQNPFTPRSVLLPAVLQIDGQAPCFGAIASLSSQGLAFDFQSTPLTNQFVGQTAQLDFDHQGQHFSFKSLIVHILGQRALLSTRNTSTRVLAALQSANQSNGPSLAASLTTLQVQHACHTQFMESMKAVVDTFYQLLSAPPQISLEPQDGEAVPSDHHPLLPILVSQRPKIIRLFTQAYPMHPELQNRFSDASSNNPTDSVDMARVDDWIRRTTIAQQVIESIQPLEAEFSHHYNQQNGAGKQITHPYEPDAVLHVLANLLVPIELDPNQRAQCYTLMGQAFQKHAGETYPAMLRILEDSSTQSVHQPYQITSLEEWLEISAAGERESADANGATSIQVNQLAVLLSRLTGNSGELNAGAPPCPLSGAHTEGTPVKGLLARDRVLGHFLSTQTSLADGGGLLPGSPAALESGALMSGVRQTLGGLSDLDHAALQGLSALMRQPPPIDPGPENLGQTSQIRGLMLQAQGLLLEFTLNGLTYQAQPDHPAWTLLNALDALHQGADNRGQFLDPILHHALNLTMQWLLGQGNVDAALEQVNSVLHKINAELHANRQSRRAHQLDKLGPLVFDRALINTSWCIIKRGDDAIPYEVLGKHDGKWALLDRSASSLLDIPENRFLSDLENGLIEEAESFDAPFLERIADATLTSSLNAVHVFTWQDPASGCLKRGALMDELERRLAHPVTEPPSFCALIEIPAMRPGLSSLPGDELTVMQKRTGEILLAALKNGEHCGRLSDLSFLMVFSAQEPDQLALRLAQLKTDMENLHPEWKMIGAAVPLLDGEVSRTPSSVLRRANQACTPLRQNAGFDLSCLNDAPPVTNRIDPLPFSSLYLRCQKIASFDEGVPSHYEILLGVDEKLVPSHTTQSFVVMAEQTGLIHELDAWVLQSVLEWMEGNRTGLATLSGLSVNLSGDSLTKTEHVNAMVRMLSRYPHLASKIILEVTETAAIDNLDVAVRSLRKLRKLGCRVALDDFGSGYSSYGYIRSLPLDYLKIDGTYINNILTDKTDQALTASMVDVAHTLGLKVIAEYVDSEAIYFWLKALGVDYVQGYWVHKPERLDSLILH